MISNILRFISICIIIPITGCMVATAKPLKLYEDADAPTENLVAFRLGGPLEGTLYKQIMPFVFVSSVDGQDVRDVIGWSRNHYYYAHILPGKHNFEIKAITGGAGPNAYYHSSETISIETVAGHTYLFRAIDHGQTIEFSYEDKGLNYNHECLSMAAWPESLTGQKPSITGC